jgi:hypothetical protein
VDLPPTLTRLLTTNIRLHPNVIQTVLARDAARKASAQEEFAAPQGT